jgi:Tfp pilus assembly protein PilF
MVQYRNGDREAARKNLDAALKSNEKFFGADEARATLQSLAGAG